MKVIIKSEQGEVEEHRRNQDVHISLQISHDIQKPLILLWIVLELGLDVIDEGDCFSAIEHPLLRCEMV
jgi:hypothetical protein